MSNKRKVLTVLALVALFLLVSSLDYQDEQMQQRHFCAGVKDGYWPNYKYLDCEDKNHEK